MWTYEVKIDMLCDSLPDLSVLGWVGGCGDLLVRC